MSNLFITSGEYLKEFKFDELYNYNNFEYLKLGNEYHIIGNGVNSTVYLTKNKLNSKYYAIKEIYKNKINTKQLLTQMNIHKRLIHRNIIELYSYYQDNEKFYLIMEYANRGNLYQLIKINNGLDEKKAFHYFIQVLDVITFLHKNYLIHRDIKPENILLNDNDEIKLADFELCVELNGLNRVTFCGTYEYMSPEIIKELPYNQSIDIWSLGILLYELTHGHTPFKSDKHSDDFNTIFKNILKNQLSIYVNISEICSDLIQKLLNNDYKNRIKLEDIYNHTWIKKYETEYIDSLKKKSLEKEIKYLDFKNIKNHVNSLNVNIKKKISCENSLNKKFDHILNKLVKKSKQKKKMSEILLSPINYRYSELECNNSLENSFSDIMGNILKKKKSFKNEIKKIDEEENNPRKSVFKKKLPDDYKKYIIEETKETEENKPRNSYLIDREKRISESSKNSKNNNISSKDTNYDENYMNSIYILENAKKIKRSDENNNKKGWFHDFFGIKCYDI